MKRRIIRNSVRVLFSAFAILFIAGCGGGGGGGASPSAAPYIFASVFSFQTGAVPPGFTQPGFNSVVSVEVLDDATGAPITDASVTLNGVQLAYSPAFQDYEGEAVITPAAAINLSVTALGATYTASTSQLANYPTISTPLSGATLSSLAANLVAWSNVAPTSNSLYALGVGDDDGDLIWPVSGSFQILASTTTSFTIDPDSLSAGSRLVLVAVATEVAFPSAAPDSSIVIGGFSYVPVTVTSIPPAPTNPLMSIAVTPATPVVVVAGTRQLTATGTYFNGMEDLTAQVTWSSSDTAKATVSTTGLVTGVVSGSVTITASLGAVSGTATITVFEPNPSPVPPLSLAVAYQIDYAHSGRATFGAPLSFPLTPTWSVNLNGAVSYPLIADGKVFVIVTMPGNSSLYALDKLTGSVSWGPVATSATLFTSASHAYDHGKVFVVNSDGLLRSFDAATGQPGWSTQLQGHFSSPPTAVNGVVYVGGGGSLGTVYAVDESTGNVLWTAGVAHGSNSSPTVSSDGVFVSYPCQVYKFDPFTGSSLWHYSGGCSGGGGRTSPYANGLLYMRDWSNPLGLVFDGGAGTQVGTFAATPIPAFSTQTGFFLSAGTLQGIDLISNNVLWSFVGDGMLISAPVVIGQVVIVGSSSGNVYALDAATGTQIWSGSAGAAISGPNEDGWQTVTGFGAGEGYLVVPAGNVLTVWHISGP
jgi:outer membrane protein assembly factor BamB